MTLAAQRGQYVQAMTDWFHPRSRGRLAAPGVIAGFALAAGVVQAVSFPPGGFRFPAAAGAVAAAAVLPLAVRVRHPLAAFGASGALGWALAVVTAAPAPAAASALAGLYAVTARCARRWSLGCCAVTLAGTGLWIGLARPERLLWQAFALPAVVVAAVWLAADRARVRRAYLAGLRERAARTLADRQADAERATATERARIARELHDVIAHHVSMIAVQAGAARMLGDQHPAAQPPREALTAIEEAARQALSELRRLLGVLRGASDGPEPDLAPPPGLHLLGDLVRQVRAAGLPVQLHVRGRPPPLSPGAHVSAYRIVQEAITNVAKHQGPVPATITVDYTADDVHLDVTSWPGRSAAAIPGKTVTGHGLIGMRERAAMLGGELHADPLPGGGYRVRARIPAAEPA
jgi:signal transduction histidine kinase